RPAATAAPGTPRDSVTAAAWAAAASAFTRSIEGFGAAGLLPWPFLPLVLSPVLPLFSPLATALRSSAFFSGFLSALSSARTGGFAGLRSTRFQAPVEKATGWFFRPTPSPHLVMTYSPSE